jgi:hypothetical protein
MTTILSKLLESDDLDQIFTPYSEEEIRQRLKNFVDDVYIDKDRVTTYFNFKLNSKYAKREKMDYLEVRMDNKEGFTFGLLWFVPWNNRYKQIQLDQVPLTVVSALINYLF